MKKVLLVLAICFIGLSSNISFSQVSNVVSLDSLLYTSDETNNPNTLLKKEKGSECSGATFSLEGRESKNLILPSETDDEEFIVVTIWVNKEGNVTRAVAGASGTTISNPYLWSRCENAAIRSNFSEKPNALFDQKGTIIYKFKK